MVTNSTNPVLVVPPSAPTNLITTAISSNSISLSWDAVTGAVAYTLQQDTSSSFTTATTITTQPGTTFTANGLTSGTTYYYRVNEIQSVGGASAWSGAVNATTNQISQSLYYYNKYNTLGGITTYSNPVYNWVYDATYNYSQIDMGSLPTSYVWVGGNTSWSLSGAVSYPMSIGQMLYIVVAQGSDICYLNRLTVMSISAGPTYTMRWDMSSCTSNTTPYSQGTLVASNIVAADGTYPVSGRATDGFWYVRGARAN